MILVDTNIWIDHFRRPDPRLQALLPEGLVGLHPYVLGELMLGNLAARSPIVAQLRLLPRPPVARHEEVMRLISTAELWGSGIGYVDAHLFASIRLAPGATLWTRDKRLHKHAVRLGVAAALV